MYYYVNCVGLTDYWCVMFNSLRYADVQDKSSNVSALWQAELTFIHNCCFQ